MHPSRSSTDNGIFTLHFLKKHRYRLLLEEEQREGGDYGCFVVNSDRTAPSRYRRDKHWATEGDNEGDKREIVRRFEDSEHLIKKKKKNHITFSRHHSSFTFFTPTFDISIILFERATGFRLVPFFPLEFQRRAERIFPCLLEGICLRGMDEGQETGKRGIKIRCWLAEGGSDRGLRHVGKLRDGSVGVRRTRGIHRGILSHSLKRASTGNTNAATWSPCRGTG